MILLTPTSSWITCASRTTGENQSGPQASCYYHWCKCYYPLLNGTSQGASGTPHSPWVGVVPMRGAGWLQFVGWSHLWCTRSLGAAIEGPTIELLRSVNRIWQHHGYGMGNPKVTQDGTVDGGPMSLRMCPMQWWRCTLEIQGRGMGAPRWTHNGLTHQGWGQVTHSGAVEQSDPENYGDPQLLEAIQSGQQITILRALGTHHLVIFSDSDAPLPKGRPPTISGLLKSIVCGPIIRKVFSRKG